MWFRWISRVAEAVALCLIATLLSGCFDHGSIGAISVPTSFGHLKVWEMGQRGGKLALAIHGGLNHLENHREFDYLTKNLTQFGYYVMTPNFHSLSRTSPGRISDDDMQNLLLELLDWSGRKSFAMLLGKGWGAAMAGLLAHDQPDRVKRLVLMHPVALVNKGLANGSIQPRSLLLKGISTSNAEMDRAEWLLNDSWYYFGLRPSEYGSWIERLAQHDVGDENETAVQKPDDSDLPHTEL